MSRGKKFTAASCSQDPASVAAFFAENGSLKINVFGADGLTAESKGHFDEAEYGRQLKAGFTGK